MKAEKRDQFIGIYVTRQVRRLLQEEATKRGVSMSVLAYNYIADGMGTKRVDLIPRNGSRPGRKMAIRGRLSPILRAAIITSPFTRAALAMRVGLSNRMLTHMVRGEDAPLTESTLARLRILAKILKHTGEVTE